MTTEAMVVMFAVMGLVIAVSSLLSGYVERSNFPQVALFLLLGAGLGPLGAGVLNVTLDSPMLRVVATLGLALVLFTDALSVDMQDLRRHGGLAALILGPGTLLVAIVVGAAGAVLLGLHPAAGAALGAALASTDPVLLRGLLRRPDTPPAARGALRLESGLNDVVLLPIILIAISLWPDSGQEQVGVGSLLIDMLILSPGVGALTAWLGILALERMRKWVGVRRDYESLYSLGLALVSFAAAEAIHGSGFLAAFSAGLTIAILDVELCDCFREYGETTAEMLLLFTFVLLGGWLMWTGFQNISWVLIAFCAIALAARPLILVAALAFTKASKKDKGVIIWFGPRGLSTLLLALVPVFEGVPGSDRSFEICAVVAVFSILIHGGSVMLFLKSPRRRRREPVSAPQEEVAPSDPVPLRLSAHSALEKRSSGEPFWLLDARSTDSFLSSDEVFEGAVRIDPQQAVRSARKLGVPLSAWAALFCT